MVFFLVTYCPSAVHGDVTTANLCFIRELLVLIITFIFIQNEWWGLLEKAVCNSLASSRPPTHTDSKTTSGTKILKKNLQKVEINATIIQISICGTLRKEKKTIASKLGA